MQYKGNILLPIFNEEQSIIELISEIELHIKELNIDFVVTLVDDGSRDKSWEIIEKLDSEYLSFRRIKLTRNFGHQPAIFAGLENFNEDFVIILDADFQDDPKYITKFINMWDQGHKIVLAKKVKRKDKSFRRFLTKFYFKIQSKLSQINIPQDVGHFCLLDKLIVSELNNMPEKNKFLLGLRTYVGYESAYVEVTKNKRKYGSSKMSLFQLINLSIEGIIGFSTVPLNLIGVIGIFISMGALLFSFYTLILNVVFNTEVGSWDFGLTSIYFLSGIQLLSISIIGQYVSKIFHETKKRPSYIVEKKISDN